MRKKINNKFVAIYSSGVAEDIWPDEPIVHEWDCIRACFEREPSVMEIDIVMEYLDAQPFYNSQILGDKTLSSKRMPYKYRRRTLESMIEVLNYLIESEFHADKGWLRNPPTLDEIKEVVRVLGETLAEFRERWGLKNDLNLGIEALWGMN